MATTMVAGQVQNLISNMSNTEKVFWYAEAVIAQKRRQKAMSKLPFVLKPPYQFQMPRRPSNGPYRILKLVPRDSGIRTEFKRSNQQAAK
ncbi:uncharacterized protein CELE_T04D3.8 [Caenorhabditis elegans]|uniref:Uncharacterized protein n=1 Tax=Caenorhabditis elegans TaxID=6239 RepID=Q95ZQ2_CAEEL|nr:Uncharacterized protein CELE_T04D3.8 [Caenorhabditis elegans]CAC42332.1 Uncharacterized protein CELE_T04D3.8 [Caenorhabditis elegans]|eukprot:NP_493342.1 Uncharacterized protein CELE_T04D3.8 [Caenorhabditis elegans]